jgi:hypothetical protein
MSVVCTGQLENDCQHRCRLKVPPQHQDQKLNPMHDFYIKNQAIALNAGLMEASSRLTSEAGRGGLNR